MISNLEDNFRPETQDIRSELQGVTTKVEGITVAAATTQTKVQAFEASQVAETSQILSLQLHIEDLEDRGR